MRPGPLNLDDRLNVRVQRLASKLSLLSTRQILSDQGISFSEWRLLVRLVDVGPCNLTAMSRFLVLDPAPTGRLVKRLEARGLLERRANPSDKRAAILSVTSAGMAVFREVWPRTCRMADALDALYTEDERDALLRLLDRAHRKAVDLLATAPSRGKSGSP